jgi:hypothetical protein
MILVMHVVLEWERVDRYEGSLFRSFRQEQVQHPSPGKRGK